METEPNFHDLIEKYYNNTIDEALISTDNGKIPIDDKSKYVYTGGDPEYTFTYFSFVDPDVVQFVDIIKSFPPQIDVNKLIVMFLQKISENLTKGQPFDEIILITDNFIDFLNFFGIPVENESLENSLIAVCNGEEGIVQQAFLDFHADPDPIKKVDNLIPKLYHALDEQSKLMPIVPYSDTSYDGGEFYYLTDTKVRPDDYERSLPGSISQASSGFSQLTPISQTLPVTMGFQYPLPEKKIGGPEAPYTPVKMVGPIQESPSAFGGPPQSDTYGKMGLPSQKSLPFASSEIQGDYTPIKMGGPTQTNPFASSFASSRPPQFDTSGKMEFQPQKSSISAFGGPLFDGENSNPQNTVSMTIPAEKLKSGTYAIGGPQRPSAFGGPLRPSEFGGPKMSGLPSPPSALGKKGLKRGLSNDFEDEPGPGFKKANTLFGFGGRRTLKHRKRNKKVKQTRKINKKYRTKKVKAIKRKTIKKRNKNNRKRKTRKHSF